MTQNNIEIISQTTSTLIHELRSPLTSLSILVDCLSTLTEQPNHNHQLTAQTVHGIKQACQRLRSMMDLQSANTKYDKLQVPKQPLHMRTLVLSVLSQHLDQHEHMPEIEQDLAADFTIAGSEQHLQHVLHNLMQNSLQHLIGIEDARMTIRLSYDDAKGYLHIEDNGRGIQPADLEHIYEPLFTTVPGRMGLGLTYCQAVMQQLGGAIHCESEPSVRTVVTLSWPKISA